MCLFSSHEELVATCDIPCVKVLKCDRDGKFYTPFFPKRVSKIVLRGLFCLRAKGSRGFKWRGTYKEVGGGYIHVYASQVDVTHDFSEFSFKSSNFVCFRCVIPKGTRYWMDDSGSGYAARKIRFLKTYSATGK